MELGLMSIASTRKLWAAKPPSSKAIAIEYGSSPVEHGRLRMRSGRRPPSSARRLRARVTRALKDSG
ncbi:hypothetical protein D3C81_2107720 [compost metagenome]